jgi:hypothetical protein
MKLTLSSSDSRAAFERLAVATQQVADIATLLDRCDETDAACEHAKRIEMDLYVLESLLRRSQKHRESKHDSACARIA